MAFPDDFTGTNGAAWSTTYWNAASVGTATIQSNKGRLQAPGGTYQYGEITSKEGGGLVGVADFDYTLELTPSVWGGSEHALYIKGRKDPSNQDWVGVTLDTSTYDNGGVVSPGSGTITAGRVRLITVTGGVIATTHGTKQITVSTTPAVVYIRFECTGSTVRLKAWRDGESEPGSWDVSATESTYQSNTGWHYGFYSGGQNGNYWDLDPYAAVAGTTVTAQVCTFTLSPQAGVITAGPVTVTAQMATFTLSPQTITPTPGPVTVTAQACTFTLSPQSGAVTVGSVTVTAQPYAFTLTPVAVTPTAGSVTVAAQPCAFTLAAQPGVVTTGAVTVTAQPYTFTLTPEAITPTNVSPGSTVTAQVCTFTFSPQAGTVTPGAVSVTAQACTFTLAPQAGVVTVGAVTVTAQPYTFTFSPQAGSITPGAITVTAQHYQFTLAPQQGTVATTTPGPTILGRFVYRWTEPGLFSGPEPSTARWAEPAISSGGDQ